MPRAKSTSFRLDTIVTPPGIYINAIIILYFCVKNDTSVVTGPLVVSDPRASAYQL